MKRAPHPINRGAYRDGTPWGTYFNALWDKIELPIRQRYFARNPRDGVRCMKAAAICFYPACKKLRARHYACGRMDRGDPM